jgi:hypothetical protein
VKNALQVEGFVEKRTLTGKREIWYFSGEKTLRTVQAILLTLTLIPARSSADIPQLPYTRRLWQATTQYLDKVETKVDPTPPTARKGTVLVIFWTSERGAVVSARAVDGPSELQQAAIEAIGQWKFKVMSVNGQPVQMGGAIVLDFSNTPSAIKAPKPLTREQLSTGYQFACFGGLQNQDATAVEGCRKQLDDVLHDSHSTPMDRFTAHDQYGLVLMKYAHDSKKAAEQFSEAIALAPERLRSSDGEWAYVYWHRAAAEQQLANNIDAEKDFSVAENSLLEAEKSIGNDRNAAYYHDLLGSAVKQHVALLEGENKHDEAKQVLAKFGQ